MVAWVVKDLTTARWMGVGDLVLSLKRTIFDLHPERPERLTNRPFLGHGGLNDAEWLASSRPLFYSNQYRSHEKGSSRLEAPQRFAPRQGGYSHEESVPFLHLPQRLDVSQAVAARDLLPIPDRISDQPSSQRRGPPPGPEERESARPIAPWRRCPWRLRCPSQC